MYPFVDLWIEHYLAKHKHRQHRDSRRYAKRWDHMKGERRLITSVVSNGKEFKKNCAGYSAGKSSRAAQRDRENWLL